ncbi:MULTISPECIES: hypothetical protein [Serratia]|uniref:Uncharacterized protein n=2 Tax=Serratia TaxID=613 RepID=A0A9X9G1H5_9GAMM|nr:MULTISPECIES: hypothetical protein [Serratia]MBS3893592.1 hypothetical protein [Serratia marcescens]TXE26692.1 hypothetical protein FOT63_20000 [Serratia ureilytica]
MSNAGKENGINPLDVAMQNLLNNMGALPTGINIDELKAAMLSAIGTKVDTFVVKTPLIHELENKIDDYLAQYNNALREYSHHVTSIGELKNRIALLTERHHQSLVDAETSRRAWKDTFRNAIGLPSKETKVLRASQAEAQDYANELEEMLKESRIELEQAEFDAIIPARKVTSSQIGLLDVYSQLEIERAIALCARPLSRAMALRARHDTVMNNKTPLNDRLYEPEDIVKSVQRDIINRITATGYNLHSGLNKEDDYFKGCLENTDMSFIDSNLMNSPIAYNKAQQELQKKKAELDINS